MVETQHSVEKMYIDGEWEASLSGEFLEVVNPANNETIGSVAYGGRKEASRAIQAAENSFMNWKNLTAKERGSILEEIYNLMIQERKELAYTLDRKSTRLNSSHVSISYAVFCLKKKKYK